MLVKNKSTEFGKEFWQHVETVSQEVSMDELCVICDKRRGDHARGKCVGKPAGTWFNGKNE